MEEFKTYFETCKKQNFERILNLIVGSGIHEYTKKNNSLTEDQKLLLGACGREIVNIAMIAYENGITVETNGSITNNIMANAREFFPHLMQWEGGFVNHPNDPGGATNKGVTLDTWKTHGYDIDGDGKIDITDLRLLSDDDAFKIFKMNYWDKLKADEIKNQSIANIMVDWLYNSGVSRIKNIQRILGVTADGISGPNTINAINSANQENLFNKIVDARKMFYERIIANNPKLETFRKGWMNRLNSFTFKQN